MSGPPSAPDCFLERETQVRGLFRDRRRKLQLLASTRCPRGDCGGLLGAACRLPDGLWVWIAGGRMSPSASRDEFRSQYLDVLDESDWDSDTYKHSAEYADEELREWGGRLQRDPVVLKVPLSSSDDEPIMTWDRSMSATATVSGRPATPRPARHLRRMSGRSPAPQSPQSVSCRLTRSAMRPDSGSAWQQARSS